MNELLKQYTCVIYDKEKIVFTSTKKGVAPMIDFYNQDDFVKKNYKVIDRIMGKGAVLLAILIGAIEIETPFISKPALKLAKKYDLKVTYTVLVDKINNRTDTGQCPIESSVLNIDNIEVGYETILNTLIELKKNA